MPAPAVMVDRKTIEDILLYRKFLDGETLSDLLDAIEMADREYDQAKAYAEEQRAALKS